jgi:hypothetical protein
MDEGGWIPLEVGCTTGDPMLGPRGALPDESVPADLRFHLFWAESSMALPTLQLTRQLGLTVLLSDAGSS